MCIWYTLDKENKRMLFNDIKIETLLEYSYMKMF